MTTREGKVRPSRAAAIALCAMLVCWMPARGQEVPGYPTSVEAYDAREVALLPPYCIHTQLFRDKVPGGNDREKIDRWKSVMGSTFEAMHHYCWGLMKTHRGLILARGEQTRRFYLADSISEFDYVIQHAPEDFVLLPEILTKKGENLIRLGRGPTGILELERAASLKPDYWPPYAYISDYYKAAGDLQKAREALQRGLTAVPDAPALKRRMAELDAVKSQRKPTH